MTTTVLPSPVAASPSASRTRVNWRQIAQTLLLVLLPCACYWPALDGAFLWDDRSMTVDNPLILAADGLRGIWFSTRPVDYFPLTYTTFWVEWRLWGNDPLGYHLVNLALHIASTFLLWRLLRALRVPGAWFGALLFAVHPVNVAAVAWIAECKASLAMVFYLASLVCWVRAEDRNQSGRLQYAAALALHILAVLSKPSVVMMPCVLLVLAWWRNGRVGWRDLGRTVPFFAVSLAAGLTTMWFHYHRAVSADDLAHANPLPVRLIVAGRTTFFYIGKIFWPHRLAMIYPRWAFPPGDMAGFLWPVGLAALLAGVWWGRRFWGRGPAATLASFVLILLPVCGLLHMAFFSFSYVSDHLVYSATPGLLALVAAWLAGFYERGGTAGRAASATMAGLVLLLSTACWQRAVDFSDPEKLWESGLRIDPHSPGAHNNLGIVLQERAPHDPATLAQAEAHFREALKSGDDQLGVAGVNLANVLRMEGRWTESAAVYRRVLAVYPEAEGFNNYGVAILNTGDNAAAAAAFRQAIRLEPTLASAYYNLYSVELPEGHLPQAVALLQACLKLDPDNVKALTALLTLHLERADQTAIPPLPAEETLAIAERVCKLTQYRGARQLLLRSKAALASGRRAEAVDFAQRAHAAASSTHDGSLVDAVEQYQSSLAP